MTTSIPYRRPARKNKFATPSRDQRRNRGQGAQRQMAEIDERRHAEKPEHLAIFGHDSRNIIQRIHEQKQRGKSPREFLKFRDIFQHDVSRQRLRLVIPYEQTACNSRFAIPVWAAAADAPRAVHDALFASYIPVEDVKDKPELTAMFTRASDQIWTAAGKDPRFQALLAPFTDLSKFGDACGMAVFTKTAGNTAFDRLTPAQRAHALYLLHTCTANDPRRLAMNLRNFYLSQTYGALQEVLTGVS